MVVETCIIGAAACLWYLVVLFCEGLAKVAPALNTWSSIATTAALTGCVGLLVHSCFDFNLHIPANAALFFFLGGVAVSQVRLVNKTAGRATRKSTVTVN